MPMDTSFLAFVAICVVVIVTPGPDTALTIRNAMSGGRRAGIATALGVSTGQLVWAACTSVGLVAVLLASEPVFHALRWLGAAYLVYLGVQSLRAACRRPSPEDEVAHPRSRLSPRAGFVQGVVNDLANPKMAIFFASVLPQFAPPGEGMLSHLLGLGCVFALLTFLWLAAYAVLIDIARGVFGRSSLRRWLEGLAGAALIGLGLRVAASDR
jgi:threonine/homoserine/homoserine lactone efflux protein